MEFLFSQTATFLLIFLLFIFCGDIEEKRIIEENQYEMNKELCEKFPFLKPQDPNYDYSYTLLDDMPKGWRENFGEQMCEELQKEVLKEQKKNPNFEYSVIQIKEKFGMLRWYDCGATKEIIDIVNKYERLSTSVCVNCGKAATKVSTDYICPWCDECSKKVRGPLVPIEDFYNKQKKGG